MQLTYAILADAANRSENGDLNILGIFDRRFAFQVPCHHPQMSLIIRFEANAIERGSRQMIGVRLLNADGKILLELPDSPLDVPDDPSVISPTPNVIINMMNVLLPDFGAYRFDITINGEHRGQAPFQLCQLQQIPGMPGMPPQPPPDIA
jgi:hypothetical protein